MEVGEEGDNIPIATLSRADNIRAWVRAGSVKSRFSRSGQGMTCFKSRDCFNKTSES